MKSFIPVYQPDLSGNEKAYVNECIDTTWISSKGRFVTEFEQQFAKSTDVSFAVSVSNGTVALHLALLALGVGPGDEVIVPSFTYVASINAIHYVGAMPVFVDIEAESWQMDCKQVERCITTKTKAIMAVHLYGHPCDMVILQQLARQHKLYLLEDCAEAFGTKLYGMHVGNFSDVATYSFFGNKTITTGEGGMVVTQNVELDSEVRHLKGQGLKAGREYWHDIVGYNYRMTNICAAIGLAQLERAEGFLKCKQNIAQYYLRQLADLPLTMQVIQQGAWHSWWMFSILTDTTVQRDALRKHLLDAGIETRPLFNPVHLMPMYNQEQILPISENIASRGVNLPSWPGLTIEQLQRIVAEVRVFFKREYSKL
ncbi:DegT/DnrJ/EryC1/StrS family aminotransferase [Methylotuvimicrobium alcaliphilum]|uniref:GDP-perosamine synthase n=1 Tax=Methylotuvimicrobium alcaliphilum (strain DSM 19304 / NCIMB 14124 / VKM B-2133 / 20Z) TaxID=1091494 RepID=G4T1L2_META2|nr:DegT/DnrJ/EryC1/StrS aminotransferase family protein [Methylotuvimicrobium alcaliphilum]CCE22434.1 putative PLP-dependent transferase [Methylotuvimicrobium alcaliphilum 20Z]